jgi:hypothetical protein
MAVTIKVPKKHQRILFTILAVAWLSGVSFFILNNWVMVEGEFGYEKHPLQFISLQIHGFTAFLMIMIFGYLLASHVKRAWKVKPKSKLGLILLIMHGWLILTAYMLYYLVGEDSRIFISYAHLSVGFFYPIILVAHIIFKVKTTRKNTRKKL